MPRHTLVVSLLHDPREFGERVRDFLLGDEAVNNLIFAILSDLSAAAPNPFSDPGTSPLLSLVENEQGVAAAAVMTPPRNLVISRVATVGAIGVLAAGLRARGFDLPGVSGPAAEAQVFAAAWSRLAGLPFVRAAAMQVYQATSIRLPSPMPPGGLRHARRQDVDLVARWITAFNEEALNKSVADTQAAVRLAETMVAPGGRSMYLWEDGGPVSMAATGGATPNGGRVFAVYTPPEHRRKGYASACVAALSRRLLDGGLRSAFLFTDLDNPTSNHIYSEIGYEPVAPFDDYRFGG